MEVGSSVIWGSRLMGSQNFVSEHSDLKAARVVLCLDHSDAMCSRA